MGRGLILSIVVFFGMVFSIRELLFRRMIPDHKLVLVSRRVMEVLRRPPSGQALPPAGKKRWLDQAGKRRWGGANWFPLQVVHSGLWGRRPPAQKRVGSFGPVGLRPHSPPWSLSCPPTLRRPACPLAGPAGL